MGNVNCLRADTVFFLLSALLFLAPADGSAVEIFPIDFAEPGWTFSLAADINASGQVVGVYDVGGAQKGFRYSGKTLTDICPPGWTDCAALNISGNGTIGGVGFDGGVQKGFVYSGGSYAAVAPAGWTLTSVAAVNDSGQSAGSGIFGGSTWGFFHDGGSFVFFLPAGYTEMRARGINGSGDVVGYGVTGGVDKAFLYKDGIVSDPSPPGWTNTRADRINDRGDILGDGESGGVSRCYLNRGGSFRTILPPGWEDSTCSDLNGLGEIVGRGTDAAGLMQNFVYRKGRYHVIEGLVQIQSLSDSGLVAGLESFDFVTAVALAGYLLPEPDLQANGVDGFLEIRRGRPLTLKGSLAVFGFEGRRSDWWVFAQTPAGPFTFDIAGLRWVPGFRPAAVMPLRDVKGGRLPPAGTAPGFYTYYLGTDLVPNGRVDVKYLIFDSVDVFVR